MATRHRAAAPGAAALLAPVLVLLLVGCATAQPVLRAPQGFAVYDGDGPWRAVSPEGVALRARLVPNEPPQTLEFWAEALKVQLEKSGYTLTAEERLVTDTGNVHILEWAAPVGEEDWIYLTALAVLKQGIAVAEAAGEYTLYRKHRQAILDSLETLSVR